MTASPTRIILVRHGHVDGIDLPDFRGRREIPLSELGVRQAELTALHLARFNVKTVYCSPLGRCLHTAELLAAPFKLSPSVNPDLTDIDYGAWQGLSHEEVRTRDPTGFEIWRVHPERAHIPGGESVGAVAKRVAHALWATSSLHPAATTILVSHDSVNRLVLLQALRLPSARYWHIKQHPCAVSIIERADDDWIVHSMNETAHLDDLPA